MPVAVKKIQLWRADIENKPGALASAIEPLAQAGANLKSLMGYRHADASTASIEIFPVTGRKVMAAARKSGFSASAIPALLVEGDDRAGLGSAIAEAVAAAEINMAFFIAQVIGRKYSAVMGFETEADAKKATPIIKKAAAKRK